MKANRKYLGDGNAILDERILAELLRGAIGVVDDLSSALASLMEVRVRACRVIYFSYRGFLPAGKSEASHRRKSKSTLKRAGAKPSPRF